MTEPRLIILYNMDTKLFQRSGSKGLKHYLLTLIFVMQSAFVVRPLISDNILIVQKNVSRAEKNISY